MTLESLAGRVIMARIPGIVAANGADLVNAYDLGGVILFDENVESPAQVRSLTNDLQLASTAAGSAAPLLVAVDQEGGPVARLEMGFTEFPAYLTLGAADDPAVASAAARVSAEELRAVGVTVVFAPDADVTIGPADPTIGARSAGDDPARVSRTVRGSVAGYLAGSVVPVLKHFPGHGSVPADSHETLPVQTASLDELEARDLVPFRDAVLDAAPSVMVAHIDVREIDPGVPASLSPKIIGLLRDDLQFDGVVFSDAQEMAAVTGGFGVGDAAVRALAAGVDVVLMPSDVAAAHDAIVQAVMEGRLPRARLAEAATRVLALALWQDEMGGEPPSLDAVGSSEHRTVSYDASLAGLAVVDGPCTGRVVGDAVQVTGGTAVDQQRFTESARRAGLLVGAGDVVRLLGGRGGGTGDVVVALDVPYGLAASSASRARIALFGRTPAAFDALVDVLVGRAVGGGTLPVHVDGLARAGCD